MKVMVDLTETLRDWAELLEDLQCDREDLESSIMLYNPMSDSLFLDSLAEDMVSDDIIDYIARSSDSLLRDRIDEFMRILGYEVNRIISVMMVSLTSVIFAVVDVNSVRSNVASTLY